VLQNSTASKQILFNWHRSSHCFNSKEVNDPQLLHKGGDINHRQTSE